MKQLIYIGGGDAHRTEDDFAEALKGWRYEPFADEKKTIVPTFFGTQR